MIYIFEIYDKRLNEWYVDFTTKDINIAEEYFNILIKTYKEDKSVIRVVTKLDI